ncbi:hypothetical protein BDR06DRAFT_984750 [Suillus hirtellus]|nr:hypothetical protein BDR06DRAFT_984750 [Suillus hirtellus]
MAKFKGWMPTLKQGEHQIKPYWHNEYCFHANDNPGEQPLRKKGHGCLIHVSDFINEEDGWLILHDSDGTILKDAQKIIYPGANGDPWWTHNNLLEQIKSAIKIHEEVSGPDCQALFIFDNLLAHTSFPPDALKAFSMNKFDGGKQCRNPDILKCRLAQRMTNVKDEPKGLKTVLEERGFNVQGLHAKCSPYCYCEISKQSFAAAKKAAWEILDSCPVEVIQWFINRSYCFMMTVTSAYRLGLTGKAAEWAVRKQRQHHHILQHAMMAIEVVLS